MMICCHDPLIINPIINVRIPIIRAFINAKYLGDEFFEISLFTKESFDDCSD